MAFPESVKLDAKRRANYRCVVCQRPWVEVHHIHPEARGGPDTVENAAPLAQAATTCMVETASCGSSLGKCGTTGGNDVRRLNTLPWMPGSRDLTNIHTMVETRAREGKDYILCPNDPSSQI